MSAKKKWRGTYAEFVAAGRFRVMDEYDIIEVDGRAFDMAIVKKCFKEGRRKPWRGECEPGLLRVTDEREEV